MNMDNVIPLMKSLPKWSLKLTCEKVAFLALPLLYCY